MSRARLDEYLGPEELEFVCGRDSALCARARAMAAYGECVYRAKQAAGADYAGRVRAGQRPTDGTWSGTYNQLSGTYEKQCQSLLPPGVRPR